MAKQQPVMTTLDELGAILVANRAPREELFSVARACIVTAVLCGQSHRTVARAFGVSPATVCTTMQSFNESHTFDTAPRSGRPPKLSERDSRKLLRIAKQAPGTTYNELRDRLPVDVSKATIRRTIRASRVAKASK